MPVRVSRVSPARALFSPRGPQGEEAMSVFGKKKTAAAAATASHESYLMRTQGHVDELVTALVK